jgi:DNA polymerase-3 subunit alpha (Gram-positive type)
MFGEDHVFKAGTISKISDKKKFAVAKKYDEKANFSKILAIANNVEGSTETSGQHPGGLMICPQEYEIYDFTPIQYPANDKKKSYTTHFDYHVIHNDLVKLDALG